MRALVVVVVLAALSSIARADDPASVVIVVDRSAAMKGERIELVRAAVRDAIEAAPDGERIAVVAFAKRANVIVPLGSNDPKRIEPAIAKLDADASFDENMTSGLELAGTLLQRKGPQHVVLITSTEASLGAPNAMQALRSRGISLSTIAVQSDVHAALDELAHHDRGRAFAVDDLIGLRRVIHDAAIPPTAVHPTSIVFVIDRSFSMKGDALEASKRAVRDALPRLASDDIVSIVAFDSESMMLVRPMAASNRATIERDLNRLQAGGGTNIFTGLKEAHEILTSQTKTFTRRVVLITDGGGASDGIKELCEDLARDNITIDTVGLPTSDRNLLSTISQVTNGPSCT